ncbi:Spherulation-specific family 4-domain-containing protein [Cadophora sp. MPI-SDFR-AT-0126]|nr:Spherulation-specific family 4-domain-containing protein [Leotiomycetes sp. MPI-SDFR-AT-0126]
MICQAFLFLALLGRSLSEPRFVAMGDSYSAGPGAGSDYDQAKYGGKSCYRSNGAYAPQIAALKLERLGIFQFLSCTGHVAADVRKYQLPDWKSGVVETDEAHLALSIGGNDLKFSKYVMACLLGIPRTNCPKTIAEIENLLENSDNQNTLREALFDVWVGLQNSYWRDGWKQHIPHILHTGYPTFFATSTDHCNNVRISAGNLVFGPFVTEALRQQTNELVDRANTRIFLEMYNFQLSSVHWEFRGKMQFDEFNALWNGHRLCEEFVKDGVGFSNPDVWFLGIAQPDSEGPDVTASDAPSYAAVDTKTCDEESGDYGVAAGCLIAKYKLENPDFDLGDLVLAEWITKAFHPKSAGFSAIKDDILKRYWTGKAANLRVLSLGDSITYGTASSDGTGYRADFYDYLTTDNYKVDMIGSQMSGTMVDSDHEGHDGASVAEISTYADKVLRKRPNVVLLYAGTDDLKMAASAASATSAIETLIDKIIAGCPDAALLVAKLVPSTDGAVQSRINSFNAALESMVQSRYEGGKRIQIMHMDVAVTKEDLADGTHPNALGYRKMAFHWGGGVMFANNEGWIQDPVAGDPSDPSDDVSSQQVAIASYINPLADPDAWNRMIGYSPDRLSVLVANAVNGPDAVVDVAWKDVIDRSAASGKTVIGYVRTGYLGVSLQGFQTRLGSRDLADWTAQIEEDVDMWYKLYGSSMGGIFFDEGWNDCGPNNMYADLYTHIDRYTKAKHPGAFTVLNPGATMPQCFEHTMDTLMTFERGYEAYLTNFTPNDWKSTDVRKIWHIIYGVPESEVVTVAKLALERGAGLIEITNDVLDNPYDNLPGSSYMQTQLSQVTGGIPLRETKSWPTGAAASTPNGLSVTTADYSSAHLTWSSSANALAYHVYLAGQLITSVTSSMTQVTVGNLVAGTSNTFTVRAVGGGGVESGDSNSATASTKSLPDGKTVINYKSSPSEGSTTITADILVPYAFVRLYIWDALDCDWEVNPGWPVNNKVDSYVCTHYMVEGETLFKYSGTPTIPFAYAPWAWTSISSVTRVISGYTYTWTLPLGTSTTDTSKFVVQTQGYGPYGTVFSPDPKDYDCQGSTLCSTPNLLSWCDKAVNNLTRNDSPIYGKTDTSVSDGSCHGNGVQYCGVFIQGAGCTISGNDMWNDYQNIRDIGGCKRCGSYHRSDGCLVTVNYVSSCAGYDAPPIPGGS